MSSQPTATADGDPPAGSAEAGSAPKVKVNWDNTIAYGLGYRVSDPDKAIIGLAEHGQVHNEGRYRRGNGDCSAFQRCTCARLIRAIG